MLNYEPFLGREYLSGRQDCYAVLRDFLAAEFQVELPNFARPERFWEDPQLDLYGRYLSQGFSPVIDQPTALGDILLMPIRTARNSHAMMVVGDNLGLHHFPGKLSTVEPLRPRWTGLANSVIRHPRVYELCHPRLPPSSFTGIINVRVRDYS